MTLIDEYIDEAEKYRIKYGDNTAVLMQVGHFYEAYAVVMVKIYIDYQIL